MHLGKPIPHRIARLLVPGLCALLGGCLFVTDAEYEQQWADLIDADDDGFDDEEFGGNDCDDTDPTVYPGAQDTWYDGIDSDCAGDDDYDRDLDDYGSDDYGCDGCEDCDDDDEEINPAAEEIWYDGVDQNCDGADDYDADGDGYVSDEYEGEDCDDTREDTYPGAEEVWYDGVDQACDGGEDYDADGDGYLSDDYGGEDCDDADADHNPESEEALGDEVDGDCDGGADDFQFEVLDLEGGTGLVGPRLELNSYEVVMGWGAETVVNAVGATMYDAVGYTLWDPGDLRAGSYSQETWTYSSDYGTWSDAFDLLVNDAWYAWASSLTYSGRSPDRSLMLDIVGLSTGKYWGQCYIYEEDGTGLFDDIQGHVDDDDNYMVAATDQDREMVSVIYGTFGEMDGPSPDYSTLTDETISYSVAETRESDGKLLLADSSNETFDIYYIDDGSLSMAAEVSGEWTVMDIQYVKMRGMNLLVVSDSVDGLYIESDSAQGYVTVSEALVRFDVAVSTTGVLYVAGVGSSGNAWLVYGTQDQGFTEASLSTGLSSVEDCAVMVGEDNTVMAAFRGDDQVVVGYVDGI